MSNLTLLAKSLYLTQQAAKDKLQTFRRLISDLLFVPLADVKIYCSNYFLLE